MERVFGYRGRSDLEPYKWYTDISNQPGKLEKRIIEGAKERIPDIPPVEVAIIDLHTSFDEYIDDYKQISDESDLDEHVGGDDAYKQEILEREAENQGIDIEEEGWEDEVYPFTVGGYHSDYIADLMGENNYQPVWGDEDFMIFKHNTRDDDAIILVYEG
jgi:hypothetical protein